MGYTVFMFVTRKPGMSVEAFVDHYENKHIPLVLEVLEVLGNQAPVRHTRYYLKRTPAGAERNDAPAPLVFFGDAATIDYDCIATVELRDEAHFLAFNEKFAISLRRKDLDEDQAAFADGSKFVLWRLRARGLRGLNGGTEFAWEGTMKSSTPWEYD